MVRKFLIPECLLGSEAENNVEQTTDFYSYWGKARPENPSGPAYHLLAYHSLDVAAVGRVLLQRDQLMRPRLVSKTGLDESALLSLVTFCLSLHDLGKFAEGF